MDKAASDEKSMDERNARLFAKIVHVSGGRLIAAQTVFDPRKDKEYINIVAHHFDVDGRDYILLINERHEIACYRCKFVSDVWRSKRMDRRFAHLLYLKLWPEVGI